MRSLSTRHVLGLQALVVATADIQGTFLPALFHSRPLSFHTDNCFYIVPKG
jgi:hypothetical protein